MGDITDTNGNLPVGEPSPTPIQRDPVEDPAEIERHARILMREAGPNSVLEVRLLEYGVGGRKGTAVGFFDNAAALVRTVAPKARYARGVYITPNPLHSGLLARARNRIEEQAEKGVAAKDSEVSKRLWLLFDFDPIRPTGIPSSDEEHAAAHESARRVRDHLSALRWPQPLYKGSGNGAHLDYRVDLPVEDGGLVQRCLQSIAAQFDTPLVKVDLVVHNPARIWKLAGTVSRKGETIPGRPRRLARIIDAPEKLEVVPTELLEALAGVAPSATNATPTSRTTRSAAEPTRSPSPAPTGTSTSSDAMSRLETWLAEAGLEHRKPFTDDKHRIIINLVTCPFDSAHGDTSVCVGELPNGAVFFKCHHNSCSTRRWKDLTKLVGRTLTGSSRPAETSSAPNTLDTGPSPPAAPTTPDQPTTSDAVPLIDRAVDRLRQAWSVLPPDSAAWRWAGAMAARRRIADRARMSLPGATLEAPFLDGAAAHERGDRVPRPELTEAAAMRISRALLALAHSPPPGSPGDPGGEDDGGYGFRILELVRRTAGDGHPATFDIVLGTRDAGAARVAGLGGRDVINYETIRAAAVEQGLALPYLGKPGNEIWGRLVTAAMIDERVESPVAGEAVAEALDAALRRVLRESPRGDKIEDLDGGQVVVHDSRLLVRAEAVLRLVRRAQPDDRVERAEVARAALRLGLVERPLLPDGTRPRSVWGFPTSVTEEPSS